MSRNSIALFLMRRLVVTGALLALVGPLHAQTVKDIIKDIKKKQGAIPVYKQQQMQTKGRVNVKISPASSSRFSTVFPEGTAERDFEEKLNKEITQLHYLSKKLKRAETKQRIWMRLAKAYSEKAALVERREQETYDKELKQYFAGSRKSKPVLTLKKAQVYNQKAIDLYRFYVKKYPRARDLDEALFFLGYNSMGMGDTSQAIKYYKALSEKFPNSDYIGEANLSLGDYYFERDRRSSAKRYYLKLAKNPRSPLGALALYKLSWVERKMGNHQAALKGLLKVIRLSKDAGLRNDRSIALAAEAKKELPMFYAEAGDPKYALTYFTNIMSREEAAKAIERLAYYYVDKGDKQEAEFLFSKLIKLNPQDDKSFDYQYSLVNMQATTGRNDLYERELYKWVRQFGPKSEWAKNSKNKYKVKDSLKKAEVALRSYVLKLHNESRTQKSKTTMLRAEKGYVLYLNSFDKSPYTDEMQFYYGELLYELGSYKDAYLAYKKVGPSKYQTKANLNAVLSLEKVIPSDAKIRDKVGKSTERFPLLESEKKFIEAGEAYLADPKNTEQRADIKYRIASIYYSHNYFEESEVEFKDIIKQYPNSRYAKFASDLIIDSYKLKKDYAGLAKAGEELINIGKKSGAVETSKVKNVLEQSAFKSVEVKAKEGAKPLKVAEAFEDFTEKYPNSEYRDQAFYNAGINYEKAGELKKALGAYAKVSSSTSSLNLYNNAQKFSAILYEKLGYLLKAAQAYEQLASTSNVDKKDKLKYFTNASVIREGFNDPEGMWRIFGKMAPLDSPENREAYTYRMAEVYQRLGDYEKARSFFIKFFNTGKGKPFLLVKSARILGDFYQDRKDYAKARYWFKAANMTYDKFKSKGAQSAASDAAYSVFRLSDQLFYKYLSIDIPSDPAKQEKVLNQKLTLVDQINKEMTKVINFDDGYSMVSALNRLGQAYQHLTFALLNTPLPKGLTKEQLVQVKKLLQDKVAPFKENAITSYKKALEKGRSLDTYNNDYLNTLFELSKIDSSFKLYRAPFIISADLIQYDSNTVESYPAFEDMMKQPEAKVLEEMSKILSKDPESSEALYTLANYYHKKGFSGISDIYIEKTNSEFKKGSKYFLMKGMNRYLENKRREAIKEFNAALKSDSEDSGLVAGVNLAALYMQYGGYEKGFEILEDRFSSPLIPQSERHKVSNNYAIGLLVQQRPDEALAEFKEALQLKSNFVDTLGNLAIFYKVVQINKKEAEQYFSQYKKLANRQVNLDRIKLMEKL